ncbi:two-component regulator propeller domain-containing protein [Candidatus Latescibacterota bacterium]
MLIRRSLQGFLVAAWMVAPLAAHNGEVALAASVQGIVLDGSLDEWPAGAIRFRIGDVVGGGHPQGDGDLQGEFGIGFDRESGALYVGIRVRDDSQISSPRADGSPSVDACEIHVSAAHEEGDPQLRSCTIGGSATGARPDGLPAGFEAAAREQVEGWVYEWRIDLGPEAAGSASVHPPWTLGLGIVLHDWDADSTFTLASWGEGATHTRTRAVGDVVLADRGSLPGPVRGRVSWEDGGAGAGGTGVRISSADGVGGWLRVETDGNGEFEVELPTGRYRLAPEVGRGGATDTTISVGMDGYHDVEMTIPRPSGVTVAAGPGTRMPVGDGVRQGQWHALGVADGLPSATVYHSYRDSHNNLWFATDLGVSRFDGMEFVNFTTDDGLAHNVVWCLLEDRLGNMWFGTQGGACRYDGSQFTTFTIEDGLPHNWVSYLQEDHSGNLWLGTFGHGVSRFDGERFVTLTTRDGLPHYWVWAIVEDRGGDLWFGTAGGAARYDGRSFRSYTVQDGLAHDHVWTILEDRHGELWFGTPEGATRYDGVSFSPFIVQPDSSACAVRAIAEDGDGAMWFGSEGGGLVRYSGGERTRFTVADGLVEDDVMAVVIDHEGNVWIGTGAAGIGRFTGGQFETLDEQDGLLDNWVWSVSEGPDGDLWITTEGGLSRYDGEVLTPIDIRAVDPAGNLVRWPLMLDRDGVVWYGRGQDGLRQYGDGGIVSLASEAGLAHDGVSAIVQDETGSVWLGTQAGLTRFDGEGLTTYTTHDGLGSNRVSAILETAAGQLWVGTEGGGVSRLEGDGFVTFSRDDGLADDWVSCLAEGGEGHVWIGTRGGVSRHDGRGFTTLTTSDGLLHSSVECMLYDADGHLWLGTGGGVNQYDGTVMQSLRRRDGLASDVVHAICQSRDGDFWFATAAGLTRYRPRHSPPSVAIADVQAGRRYGPVTSLRHSSAEPLTAFEFVGRSFRTRPRQIAYTYRLLGLNPAWQVTRRNRAEYSDLAIGQYEFQVRAVDADLTYSPRAASVRLVVHPPYRQVAYAACLLFALLGMAVATVTSLKRKGERDRARQELVAGMEKELQTARQLQMALMPQESPQIRGYDIAGVCWPASEVGGDFFQYYAPGEERLAVCVADATGHAMAAAMPIVMFSGILNTEMRRLDGLESLFASLNETLCERLQDHTFVCLSMAQLDTSSRRLQLCNCGCPYPYHYHAATAEVTEWATNAYPLGVRLETAYERLEGQLETGDWLVLYTDGFCEAANAEGESFGDDRIREVIRKSGVEDLTARALIDRLVAQVETFVGELPQADDMTVVVVKVEG